jgi:deoxyribonuclease IV
LSTTKQDDTIQLYPSISKRKIMKPLIGAHTSIAGGIHLALTRGVEIGATTIQIFTSNQRQWKGHPIEPAALDLWKTTLKETGLKNIMSHDSYLINLGSPDPENLQKSRHAFVQEIQRCLQLELSYLNFHPGAALKEPIESCLNRIVENLLEVAPLLEDSSLHLLLEATAGQGSTVGCRFEELAYIINAVKHKLRIGVCIDTCHIFVAGYDIRTAAACDHTLKEFDRIVGLQYLQAFHLNDSMKGLGSRVDRHAPLGKGEIGWECFKYLMTDPRTKNLPKYLETPEGPEGWIKEISILKQYAESN